jgi:hypothetical protein
MSTEAHHEDVTGSRLRPGNNDTAFSFVDNSCLLTAKDSGGDGRVLAVVELVRSSTRAANMSECHFSRDYAARSKCDSPSPVGRKPNTRTSSARKMNRNGGMVVGEEEQGSLT